MTYQANPLWKRPVAASRLGQLHLDLERLVAGPTTTRQTQVMREDEISEDEIREGRDKKTTDGEHSHKRKHRRTRSLFLSLSLSHTHTHTHTHSLSLSLSLSPSSNSHRGW